MAQALSPSTKLIARFVEILEGKPLQFPKGVFKQFNLFRSFKDEKSRYLASRFLAILELFESENPEVYKTLFVVLTEDCRRFNKKEDPLGDLPFSKVLKKLKEPLEFEEFLKFVRERFSTPRCKGDLVELLTFRVISSLIQTCKEAFKVLETFRGFEFEKELRLFLTSKGILEWESKEWDCVV